ncbi:hypothetical protein M758_8G115400 [Ceratodon purpureus]|nr:hypothetical protein M758_8G115400 [Ceratodon purpureus]
MITGLVEIEASYGGCCPPLYMDCDNNATNGCETNIVGDVKNCGSCGTLCHPMPPSFHAHVYCTNGICEYICEYDAGDCDYDIVSNGCETNLSGIDPNNCGECASHCADYTSELPDGQADSPYYYVDISAGNRIRTAKIFQFRLMLLN